MKVETIIRNSEKNEFAIQVTPSLIVKELEDDMQKSKVYNQQEGEEQGEIEVSEEVLKKVDRFLRKITPLMEKELEENLPLYARTNPLR